MIVPGFDTVKSVPVGRELLEKLSPALNHRLFWLMDIPVAIDEGMVLCHQRAEALKIPVVDAIIEEKYDKLGVFRVHRDVMASVRRAFS